MRKEHACKGRVVGEHNALGLVAVGSGDRNGKALHSARVAARTISARCMALVPTNHKERTHNAIHWNK